MTDRAVLLREVNTLPENRILEVLDFVGYLKQKEAECPLCARYTEPNEETIAALEEGDALRRGEIPAKWYHSAEAMLAALDKDD